MISTAEASARIGSTRDAEGRLVVTIGGALDAAGAGTIWREALELCEEPPEAGLTVDASGVEALDGSGAAMLAQLRGQEGGGPVVLTGLKPEFERLVEMVSPAPDPEREEPNPLETFVERVGSKTLGVVAETRALVAFTGELFLALLDALRHPRRIRWRDLIEKAEETGIEAMPIIGLMGFLFGLILAFQSAVPMRQFGAEIFVADLLGLSMMRELGPLLAAILLTARSGSAFAAELGTMKVNEEIDALSTMGLQPVRFLVVPRVLAVILVVPVLTILMVLFSLAGGAVVMMSLGFPFITYMNRVVASTSAGDMAGGLFKALVFGLVIAGVGCLRGIRAGNDAGAVGASTTSSVVSGIVLITVIDGLFAVVFFVLGI